ncbi:MAG TPA: DUF222 domain-containing protein [Actinomycetota bacterium]|nr:DUF222 domain-containing protein [Actinomycetota bacterium]
MFDSLDSAISSLQAFVEGFRPEHLSKENSLAALERFCRAEKLCAAGKALASRQVATPDAWYDSLERSPAHLIAKASGSSVKRAGDVLETAELLKDLPDTERAFRSGRLSESQAIEMASAVAMDPETEQALLEAAEYQAFLQLQRECQRVRAAAMDEQQKHDRAHRRRHLSHWVDPEGVFHLQGRMTPKAGAVVVSALEPFKVQLLKQAASPGKVKESDGALLVDALVEMAEQARCGGSSVRPGPQAMVQVRVDLAALLRGYTEKGEVCEVPGVGPIPVAAARELSVDSFLYGLLYEANDIVAEVGFGRTISASLRRALAERDQVCVVSGCDRMCCLEFDHVTEFAKGGSTSLGNLVRMCGWHHSLKTYHGYRLERIAGRWILTPPPDLGQQALQPEFTGSRMTLVRRNRIREMPGKAPPKKRTGGGYYRRPRPGEDVHDPTQRPFAIRTDTPNRD